MGYVIIEGEKVHTSLLPALNQQPFKWISPAEFEAVLKENQHDVPEDVIDLLNENFWDLV